MLVHYKDDKPKRQKFNKYKAYGLRLSYAPIIDIHIRRNAEQKSSVFSFRMVPCFDTA